MQIAVRLNETGGPEVMQVVPVEERDPAPGSVWLDQEAVGVNVLDLGQRSGSVPIDLPSGLGLEGAGRVSRVGAGVRNVTVGDRVAYILGPIGAYASARAYPADRLVRLPEDVSSVRAAAVLFKGITAHYLLHATFPVERGTTMVLYGATGALGRLMVPWAKALGARVIGIVKEQAAIPVAEGLGCDAALAWADGDLPAAVADLTESRLADVVYDGVGKASFATSLDLLRPRGLMVSLGASSGVPDPVSVATLNAKGSLFLTRPSLAAHATDLGEYRMRAAAVLDALRLGVISGEAAVSLPLAKAAAAHARMEAGNVSGAMLLIPEA